MSINIEQFYLSIGGNRHSAASAWHAALSCLAFGADQNIALWQPLNESNRGAYQLLRGHTDKVTSVAFLETANITLVSGAANGELVVWSFWEPLHPRKTCVYSQAHAGAVNVVTAVRDSPYFVTGGADASIKIWIYKGSSIDLLTTTKPKPRFIPLALAAGTVSGVSCDKGFLVTAAGTRNDIQVYSVSIAEPIDVTLACSLTGHEGWVRSLALVKADDGNFMLASTSADKYVRLWRFQERKSVWNSADQATKNVANLEQTLTAKVKTVSVGSTTLLITFEALLLGHDDWVYSADWQDTANPKLLTASADGTVAIWEPDSDSGIWISETRLGEISGQKGATTATGSSGGFWTGKWVSNADTTAIVSLGRTGSWRLWLYDTSTNFWELKPGIGGHADSTNSVAWSPRGEYLLSTSSDQTTRLHAAWKREQKTTWHEFSRCQIHGYNCNVVTCISSHQFVSGADEKLLRVFNEPKELADALHRLCGVELPTESTLPETAAIPVLGLSNKEMGEPDDIIEAGPRRGNDEYAAASALTGLSLRDICEPPSEDLLSRHTLWPEHEKLYGHGYEISETAYSNGILATACKASSIDHATIRLYDAQSGWQQIGEPLAAHSLTVTRLDWHFDSWLLSVGRDRQWTVFERKDLSLKLYQAMPKAHTRMILDAAFSGNTMYPFFVTAGRDKTLKLWGHDSRYNSDAHYDRSKAEFKLYTSLTRPSAVTAVALTEDLNELCAVIAVGEEDGSLSIHVFALASLKLIRSVELDEEFHLPKAVNRLAFTWRNFRQEAPFADACLAVAGADGSVRILTIDIVSLCQEISEQAESLDNAE